MKILVLCSLVSLTVATSILKYNLGDTNVNATQEITQREKEIAAFLREEDINDLKFIINKGTQPYVDEVIKIFNVQNVDCRVFNFVDIYDNVVALTRCRSR